MVYLSKIMNLHETTPTTTLNLESFPIVKQIFYRLNTDLYHISYPVEMDTNL